MSSVLLLEPKGADRDFFRDALQAAGHTVRAPADVRAALERLDGADVVLASSDVGLAEGWFRSVDAVPPPPVPIVIMSEFRELLVVLEGHVAATLEKPATARETVEAVHRALGTAPPRLSRFAEYLLASPQRDAEMRRRELADASTDKELYAVADLVARGVEAPVGLVTLIDSQRQYFVGHVGLPADMEKAGGTLRLWSFCQHAVRARAPLVVRDAKENPLFAEMPMVAMNLVRAYAGVPIEVEGIGPVGTVCALSDKPRQFTKTDLAVLELGARLAGAKLARRKSVTGGELPPRAAINGDPRIGTLLDGKYWITAPLGEGGQSSVVLARDKVLGQLVAIKVMHGSRDADELLLREARALSRVRHPNIVQLHGWGKMPDHQIYLVLEYVEGSTLREVISAAKADAEPLPLPRVAKVIRELAGALSSMHAVGLVHGDVKPSNIILDVALDRAVLIDFGIGMSARPDEASGPSSVRGGTPGFSAPEQFALDQRVTPHAWLDVYGVAAVAYAMLVGEGPFTRVRSAARVHAQNRAELVLPSVARPGIPKEVDDVIAAALSPDPAARPPTVMALADALESALGGSTSPPAPSGPTPRSRGSAFGAFRQEARKVIGVEAEARVFASLTDAERRVFDEATDPADFYPAPALVAYVRAYGDGDAAKIEAFGASLAVLSLPELLRTMKITRTPETLLHVTPSILHRFHDWGHLEVARVASDAATWTVHLPPGFAPMMCRYLAGALDGLMSTTPRQVRIEETACAARGAAACAFAVSWTP